MKTSRTSAASLYYPSPLTKHFIKRLLQLSQSSFARDWHPGTGGNFSVLAPGGIAWVSASGRHKGKLQLGDFLPVDIAKAKVLDAIYQKPSDETALHCAIYRRDSTARSVLHVHTPYTVAAADSTEGLTLGNNEMLKVFGLKSHEAEVALSILPNTQDMETLGQTLDPHLDVQTKILILKGHGVYAWGADPDEAMYRIEALEYLCQLRAIAHSLKSSRTNS